MKKSIIYSTENSNSYLYDVQYMFAMLIHPELKRAHEESIDVNPYYYEKYKYLIKYGFFKNVEPVDFEMTLKESIVKENIVNIKQIVFEVTDYCNLSCQYCSLGELYDFSKKNPKNLDIEHALKFLKYIFDIKKDKTRLMISFFGGEPLANIAFIKKIVEESKLLNADKKLELEFNMTTNATLIDKEIDFLVDNDFVLLVSLDGNEKGQSYRVFANGKNNSFDKVVRNIDAIQQKYPEYFLDNVDFNAVIHDKNSIKEIYEFIYNRYHKIPRISQLSVSHINPDKKDFFDSMFRDRMKSENDYIGEESDLLPIMHTQLMLFKESRMFLKNYSINFYIPNLLYLLYDQITPVPTGSCSSFQKKIYLNTDHDLLPCEKVSYKYSLGKVNDKITIDIPEIVKKYNFYYKHFKEICQYCYAAKSCPICLLTLDNLENLGTIDFSCPGFQNQESFENKLNRIFSFLEKYPNDLPQIFNNLLIE